MASCTACSSPKIVELDAALIQGMSVREAAKLFGISKSAVERHKNSHLKARLTAASRREQDPAKRALAVASGELAPVPNDLLSLNGVMGRLAKSLARLEDAAEAAADTGAYQGLAAVSGQLHRAVDAVCKIQGLYAERALPAPTATFGVQIILPGGGQVNAIATAPSTQPAIEHAGTYVFDTDALPPMPDHVMQAMPALLGKGARVGKGLGTL